MLIKKIDGLFWCWWPFKGNPGNDCVQSFVLLLLKKLEIKKAFLMYC